MASFVALAAGGVLACYGMSVLFGIELSAELLFMAMTVIGLPVAVHGAPRSRPGPLPQVFGYFMACACAATLAW